MTRQPPTYAPPWHAVLTALLIELWRCIRQQPEPEPDPEELSVLFGFEQGPLETHYQLFCIPPEFARRKTVNARFRRFAEAYLTLSDPEQRAACDAAITRAFRPRTLLTRGHLDRSGPAYRSGPPVSLDRLPPGADGLPPAFLQPHWGTPYQVLRLDSSASREEIDSRFRQMLEAYVTLSDPQKRQAYNIKLQVKTFSHDFARIDREHAERAASAGGHPSEA